MRDVMLLLQMTKMRLTLIRRGCGIIDAAESKHLMTNFVGSSTNSGYVVGYTVSLSSMS